MTSLSGLTSYPLDFFDGCVGRLPTMSRSTASLRTDCRVEQHRALDENQIEEADMIRKYCYLLVLGTLLGAPHTAAFAGSVCDTVPIDAVWNLSDSSLELPRYFYSGLPEGDIGLGGDADDVVGLDLYSNDLGVFALGQGNNSNYLTCVQCLLVTVDLPTPTYFFAAQGSVSFDGPLNESTLHAVLSDVRLVEVTIDPETFISTPVVNGQCLEMDSTRVWSDGFETQ